MRKDLRGIPSLTLSILLSFLPLLSLACQTAKLSEIETPLISPTPVVNDEVNRTTSEPYTGDLSIFENAERDKNLQLALACDHRIGAPNAVFSHPGVGLGIITGWSGTQRLPRLIGQTNALEMFLTAKRVDAVEALRIGLVDTIVNDPLASSLAFVLAAGS